MRVDFGPSGLVIDGRHIPLVAGEFNFWRHNPEDWQPILREMHKLGVEIVTTFVCWDFHERERGHYTFGSGENPMRDLDGFLDAIADEGMLAILRPGPIIDSEWPTRGPAPDVATLERTDPRFRQRAAEWLAAVGPVIARHQVPHGPVVLVQLDNEVFYPHCTEASATEADSAFHIPYDEERIFSDLDSWDSTGDPTLPRKTVPLNSLDEGRQKDAFRFLRYEVTEYLQWVEQRLRTAGVAVPCYTNVKQSCAYLDLQGIGRAISGGSGGNNYMDRLRSEEEFLVAVWWNGLQRALTHYHWAPEYWCGRWIEEDQDTSIFRPEHYRFCALTHVALGLRGLNYFMLVERDDWHYSPITGIGRVRDRLAAPIAEINGLLRQLGPDERIADVALIWSLEMHQRVLIERGFDWTELSSIWWEMDQPKEHPAWWETLRALVRADVDFVLLDRHDPRVAEFPVVVVPEGTPPPEPEPRAIVTCPPQQVVDRVRAAGARRAISSSSPALRTTVYQAPDGSLRGFCINATDDDVQAELLLSRSSDGNLDLLIPPAAWDARQHILVAPGRSVAAFVAR